jgi:hypothetical protein
MRDATAAMPPDIKLMNLVTIFVDWHFGDGNGGDGGVFTRQSLTRAIFRRIRPTTTH